MRPNHHLVGITERREQPVDVFSLVLSAQTRLCDRIQRRGPIFGLQDHARAVLGAGILKGRRIGLVGCAVGLKRVVHALQVDLALDLVDHGQPLVLFGSGAAQAIVARRSQMRGRGVDLVQVLLDAIHRPGRVLDIKAKQPQRCVQMRRVVAAHPVQHIQHLVAVPGRRQVTKRLRRFAPAREQVIVDWREHVVAGFQRQRLEPVDRDQELQHALLHAEELVHAVRRFAEPDNAHVAAHDLPERLQIVHRAVRARRSDGGRMLL